MFLDASKSLVEYEQRGMVKGKWGWSKIECKMSDFFPGDRLVMHRVGGITQASRLRTR